MFNKLSNAIKTKGVVISTPTAIKSIMLKLLEMMHLIEDPGVPHHPQMEVDAREIARVLGLFRDGVLIMVMIINNANEKVLNLFFKDEVDLILHPLKSELNFPIGPKLDLDFNPLRWYLHYFISIIFLTTSIGNYQSTCWMQFSLLKGELCLWASKRVIALSPFLRR